MQLSYSQKVVLSTVLVLLVVFLMLALTEGAVRLRQWVKYGHAGQLDAIYTVDQETGLRVPVANASTRTISINSLGFRGPPVKQPKPAGTMRLTFLGASTTFCAEVSGNELTWPYLVTQALQDAIPDINFDFVNGAVPGYTVESSLRNLRKRVAPLQPDVIVIYHATNDLSQETRSLALEQGIYENGKVGEKSWLAEYSLLWYLVEKNLRLNDLQRDAVANKERLVFSPAALGAQFRKELISLVTEAREVAGIVTLVTFSHQVRPEQTPEQQLIAAKSALYYMPFMTPHGLIEAFTQYNEIIRDVARETGAVLIEGETVIPGDSEHFNDSVHFKDAGSRAMARRVSEVLLKSAEFRALAAGKRSGS
jgi:lysophospholipase L1-like esterase